MKIVVGALQMTVFIVIFQNMENKSFLSKEQILSFLKILSSFIETHGLSAWDKGEMAKFQDFFNATLNSLEKKTGIKFPKLRKQIVDFLSDQANQLSGMTHEHILSLSKAFSAQKDISGELLKRLPPSLREVTTSANAAPYPVPIGDKKKSSILRSIR